MTRKISYRWFLGWLFVFSAFVFLAVLVETGFAKPSVAIPGSGDNSTTLPLEEDLFKRLMGDDVPEGVVPDENPLKNAVEGMRNALERIEKDDLSRETQQIQQKVVDDLQKLIDLANQRQSQSRSRQRNGSENQRQQKSGREQSPEGGQQQQQPSPSKEDPSGQQNRNRPEDSDDGVREGEVKSADLLRQRRLVEEVWGHLPPALRERMRNIIDEKYLPNYDELIRRYFKSLAEEEPKPRRK